ncbi:MAG: PilT/PilU family type 4a pilus ATPase [Candidatus Pacebacteria bacterium]|nr:PilT/PilU family type 4a pilus ATPase [Candidatus Paceibacterota bacterium]MDD2757253.1 PilT/PilU family type 4a pilus ATPase [Candidatus Paceibacterota bacterium]MDD3283749.1 PilT/PilU family type 4a pilus ATPase [Candidatus Paceibacterota bacterium]MDD3969861.1 PilT/PilU family type 4a pilus ATPase [Candidatus Paceibacterota bacterium]MDD4738011.1 PilT/PilU family type 4a pilus ATPase [Candidatus Paceibacterota bacterium]
MMTNDSYLKKLLDLAIKNNASDIHFSDGYYPVFRINRSLIFLNKENLLNAEECKKLAYSLMNENQIEIFLNEKEVDFSYNFEGRARFRVNIFFKMGTISSSLRLIPQRIKTISELNLPSGIKSFLNYNQGLILVVGPSSHGKSSTLAAIIEEINQTKASHIITIEDPVEYIFSKGKSIVSQRELGTDTKSFAGALRASLREDPDVIMVGEMRDSETMAAAITAAETGHLVFATLHTNSAAQTIHRIVDSFDSIQQSQIRSQLSGSLVGIISQRLIPGSNNLFPACEILFNNSAIANIIRENKIYEIPLVIDTSMESGMISLNRSLSTLLKNGKISIESALKYSNNPRELKKII